MNVVTLVSSIVDGAEPQHTVSLKGNIVQTVAQVIGLPVEALLKQHDKELPAFICAVVIKAYGDYAEKGVHNTLEILNPLFTREELDFLKQDMENQKRVFNIINGNCRALLRKAS